MPLKTSRDNSTRTLTFIEYSDEHKVFKCSADDGLSVEISIPLSLDLSHRSDEVDVYFLRKLDLKENDIHAVFDEASGTRIGWCFPVLALSSDAHDYANDQHFLPYAYLGAVALLQTELPKSIIRYPQYSQGDVLRFTDFVYEDTAIMVLNKEYLKQCSNLTITNCTPTLFCYGYVWANGTTRSEIKHKAIKTIDPKGKLNLRPMACSLPNREFIEQTFSVILAEDNRPLSRFFYGYQIIELLTEYTFSKTYREKAGQLYLASSEIRKISDILHDLGEQNTQRKRFAILTQKYTNTPSNSSDLLNACNDFLETIGLTKGTTPPDCVYAVRNTLFHQYRDVHGHGEVDLAEATDQFLIYISELLCTFNDPEDECYVI